LNLRGQTPRARYRETIARAVADIKDKAAAHERAASYSFILKSSRFQEIQP
jgi:hypothetical protein